MRRVTACRGGVEESQPETRAGIRTGGAALFGLFAAYQALVLSYGITPPEAAGTLAFIAGLLASRRK